MWFSTLLLAWLGLAPPALAKPDKAPKEKPPKTGVVTTAADLDVAALAAIEAELIPLVEEAAGAKFTTVPPVRIGTTEALELVVVSEARDFISRLYQAPPAMIDDLVEQSRVSVPGIVGKYAVGDKSLYVSPHAVDAISQAGLTTPEQTMDVVRLVMAHELTHALQDQQVDFAVVFANCRDMDAFQGLRGVTEGHANFVEQRVAAELGLQSVYESMNMSQGWNEEGLQIPAAFSIWAIYGQGRQFVQYHYAIGGLPRTWEVMREPPPSTTMLFRPHRYAATIEVPRDYASVLTGVEQILTRGDWAVINANLGEFDLRAESVGLDQARLGEILGHLVHGQELQANRPDRSARVRILDFEDKAWSSAFVTLLEEQQAQMSQALSSPMRPVTVTVTPYEGVTGDLVVERVIAPEGAHATSEEKRSVWVVRGNTIVVVDLERFRPGIRLDQAMQEVFQRWEALIAKESAR